MTNCEKFEQEKLSFAEVMELFKKSGMMAFDRFLKMPACKYKPGDIVVMELNDYTKYHEWKHNVVLEILGFHKDSESGELENCYDVKFLTPTEGTKIGDVLWFHIYFIDKNTHLY